MWSVLGEDVIFEGIEVGRLFEYVFWMNKEMFADSAKLVYFVDLA